jgi:hypothetical protein
MPSRLYWLEKEKEREREREREREKEIVHGWCTGHGVRLYKTGGVL